MRKVNGATRIEHHRRCPDRRKHGCAAAEDFAVPVDSECRCGVCIDPETGQRPYGPDETGELKLRIWKEQVQQGIRSDPEQSPLALALRAIYPNADSILVDEVDLDVRTVAGVKIHAECGRELGKWVIAYNEGTPVEPRNFEVQVERT